MYNWAYLISKNSFDFDMFLITMQLQIQNDKRQHITEAMWTGFATVVTIPSVWSHFSFVVRAVRVVKKLILYYKECSQITNHRLKNIENEQP